MSVVINTGVQQVFASEPIISIRNSLDSLDLGAPNWLYQAKPLAASNSAHVATKSKVSRNLRPYYL